MIDRNGCKQAWRAQCPDAYRQQPCLPINTVDPDVIAIAAGTKQIASIGRNPEITGMNACKLIADLCQPSCLLIDFKYRDSVCFQTITGI